MQGSYSWAYGLTSSSEKMRKSNHLQMLEQRQHGSLEDSGQRGSVFRNRTRSCLMDPIYHLTGLKIIGSPFKYRRCDKNRGPFTKRGSDMIMEGP